MIAGNWKMNLRPDEAVKLIETISSETKDVEGVEILVAPPLPFSGECERP